MAHYIRNLQNNPNAKGIKRGGPFTVVEYQKDMSMAPDNAMAAYYNSQMNVRKRQLFCNLSEGEVVLQPGAMQWTAGQVDVATDVEKPTGLVGRFFRSKATGDTAIKPRYHGTGTVVLEPTYRHLILLNVEDWGGSVVLEDGLFLACTAGLKQSTAVRSSVSSAAAGNEGLFNLCLSGSGIVCLTSTLPEEELLEVELVDDVLRIDGNFAVVWSGSLEFTVERAGPSLLGSAFSGEGLVNVYRGTGRVLMAPLAGRCLEENVPESPAEPQE